MAAIRPHSVPVASRSSTSKAPPKLPFLKFSRYDVSAAVMMSVAMAVVCAVIWAFSLFYATLPPRPPELVPMELVRIGGGVEDGDPNETLDIESPEETTTEIQQQEEVKEEIVLLTEVADQAAERLQEIQVEQTSTAELNGSATGSGKRPLGFGPGNGGGVAAELRWFIRFADGSSLTEYAKQLDFFGIELGAVMPDARIAYISNLSGSPKVRYGTSGKDEKRLYMKWDAGDRRKADEKLFQKAGITVGKNVIFHFYPQATEQMLVTLETNYAKRDLKEIRRTYFVVNTKGAGYEFQVTRQMYLK